MSDDELGKQARSFLDEALAVEPELEQGPRRKMRAHVLGSVAGASMVAAGGATAAAAGATAAGASAATTVFAKAVAGVVALGLVGGGATAAWQRHRPRASEVVAAAAPVRDATRPGQGASKGLTLEAPRAATDTEPVAPGAPSSGDETAAVIHDDAIRPRREAHPIAKGAPVARTVAAPDTFPEELAVLERARAALASGDWQGVLREIAGAGHLSSSRTFAEEREALRILALCSGGRETEGRRWLTSFRASFPRSLQMERIERACSKVVTDVEPGGHSR